MTDVAADLAAWTQWNAKGGPPARLQELLAETIARWREGSALSYKAAKSSRKGSAEWWMNMTAGDRDRTLADEVEALLSSSAGAAKNTKTKT